MKAVSSVGVFLLLAVPGFLLTKKKILTGRQVEGLSSVLVNFLWPAMVVDAMAQVQASRELVRQAGQAALWALLVIVVGAVCAWIWLKVGKIGSVPGGILVFAAEALSMAADATAPMVLLLVGAQLGEGDLKALVRDKKAWILTALRLLVIPAAVLGLWRLCLGQLTDVAQTLVLLSAMPGGTCCALFTRQYGGDWGLATRCVMLSTLCAVVTVPLWLMVTIL